MIRKIAFLLLGILVLFGVYKFVLNSAERDIESEKASFNVSAQKIIKEFSDDSAKASTNYQDKTIEITGVITNSEASQLILDGIVICEMTKKDTIAIGKKATIKGRFVGYDDLMGELKMDQSTLIK